MTSTASASYKIAEEESKKLMNSSSEIYVDKILPKGTCQHFKKLKGFNETLRKKRDTRQLLQQSNIKSVESQEQFSRFTGVKQETDGMKRKLDKIIKLFHTGVYSTSGAASRHNNEEIAKLLASDLTN